MQADLILGEEFAVMAFNAATPNYVPATNVPNLDRPTSRQIAI
jgi:hypothetical protein